jgi:hypothetical protein
MAEPWRYSGDKPLQEEMTMSRLAIIAIATAIFCTGLSTAFAADETGVGFGSPTTTVQSTPNRQLVRIRTRQGETVVVKDRVPDYRKPSIVEYD